MEVKQVKALLEAYSSIYEKKEEPEMKESEKGESEKGESGKDEGGKHKEGKHPKGKEEKGEKVKEKEGKETEKEMKESADLFDYILEHLVAEGYADTNKAALAIMANMSEEWKQSIVEQSAIAQRTAAAVDDQRRGSYGMADDLNKTRKSLDKLKPYPNGFPNASGVKGV